jgi:hypothetical protein
MNLTRIFAVTLMTCSISLAGAATPGGGSVSGKVTLNGTAPKPKPYELSKEPECAKMHAANPLMPDTVLTGPGNSLRNVVVYISSGDSENVPPPSPVVYDQQGCHYTTHVQPLRVGQEIKISNSDPISHNIHPLAKVNREWNKIQPPGTPPFGYAFDREEIIPIKCNIHPWMSGYFVVLKTSHYMITGEDGRFSLPNLPPGHYVITAWHELYGTQSKEITVGGAESQSLDFTFTAKP